MAAVGADWKWRRKWQMRRGLETDEVEVGKKIGEVFGQYAWGAGGPGWARGAGRKNGLQARAVGWVHFLYRMHPCVVYTYNIYIYVCVCVCVAEMTEVPID
jgi:hypothetical protein